jgi:hypothetical protein
MRRRVTDIACDASAKPTEIVGFTLHHRKGLVMNNENTRVLGRVLAVEETHAVSGARPTSVLTDQLTTKEADSFVWFDNPQP